MMFQSFGDKACVHWKTGLLLVHLTLSCTWTLSCCLFSFSLQVSLYQYWGLCSPLHPVLQPEIMCGSKAECAGGALSLVKWLASVLNILCKPRQRWKNVLFSKYMDQKVEEVLTFQFLQDNFRVDWHQTLFFCYSLCSLLPCSCIFPGTSSSVDRLLKQMGELFPPQHLFEYFSDFHSH